MEIPSSAVAVAVGGTSSPLPSSSTSKSSSTQSTFMRSDSGGGSGIGVRASKSASPTTPETSTSTSTTASTVVATATPTTPATPKSSLVGRQAGVSRGQASRSGGGSGGGFTIQKRDRLITSGSLASSPLATSTGAGTESGGDDADEPPPLSPPRRGSRINFITGTPQIGRGSPMDPLQNAGSALPNYNTLKDSVTNINVDSDTNTNREDRISFNPLTSFRGYDTASYMYPGGGFGQSSFAMARDPLAFVSGRLLPEPQKDTEALESQNFDEVYIFLLRVTLALHLYGAPVHKTEYNFNMIRERLSLDASVSVLPTMIFVAIGNYQYNNAQTLFIPALPQGLHAEKLQLLDELCDDVMNSVVDFHSATDQLDKIVNSPVDNYPPWVQILAFGFAACGIDGLFFQGSWQDIICSFVLGCFTGILCYLTKYSPSMGRIVEGIAATIIAFITTTINLFVTDICTLGVSLTAVTWLLPGLSITIAISELAARMLISGTVKLFFALLIFVQLGFGLAIGEKLAYVIFQPESIPLGKCGSDDFPSWMKIFFCFLCSFAFSLLSRCAQRQFPGMIFVSFVAWIAYTFSNSFLKLSYDLSTVIAAAFVAIAANALCRWARYATIIPLITGILLLLPGSVGVKGVRAMMTEDLTNGITFGFQMIIVSVSITVGIFIGSLILPPKSMNSGYQ